MIDLKALINNCGSIPFMIVSWPPLPGVGEPNSALKLLVIDEIQHIRLSSAKHDDGSSEGAGNETQAT